MNYWLRKGYKVVEKEFDFDLHEFDVILDNGETIATITPYSIESMEETINALNNGSDVDGWEDGMGNTIRIPESAANDMTNWTELESYNLGDAEIKPGSVIVLDENANGNPPKRTIVKQILKHKSPRIKEFVNIVSQNDTLWDLGAFAQYKYHVEV